MVRPGGPFARVVAGAALGSLLAVAVAPSAARSLPARRARPERAVAQSACADELAGHPDWIFCDDFESRAPLVGPGRYFEHDDDDGDFAVLDGVGRGGSRGLRGLWQAGEVGAGSLKLAFGRNPNRYMQKGIRPAEDFRDVYYRMRVMHQPGWQGNPAKLSRATIFPDASTWSQAMIAHLWGGRGDVLLVDPVRCVGSDDRVKCTTYNDFDNMDWIGNQNGRTPVFATANGGTWFCVEAHVRLNDPGQANGVHEFWVDGRLEARREGLDFVRSWREYGINAIFFENYWNDGSPKAQWRVFDDIVVATQPIGCGEGEAAVTSTSTATAAARATSTPTPSATATAHPSSTESANEGLEAVSVVYLGVAWR